MKEITKVYDSIHMPEELEKKILKAAPARKNRFLPAAAAVFAVMVLMGCSPQVQELVKTSFPELGLTIYEQEPTKEGEARGNIVHVNTELPTFAHAEDGRLYFTGNDEQMDITDQITPEKPFYYTYEDEQGYTITLVVGYDGTLENFGTYTYIQKDGEHFTDAGRNIFSDTQEWKIYPWVEVMWQELEIPWAMPGKDVDVDIVIND